jgi:hypothetical protein
VSQEFRGGMVTVNGIPPAAIGHGGSDKRGSRQDAQSQLWRSRGSGVPPGCQSSPLLGETGDLH